MLGIEAIQSMAPITSLFTELRKTYEKINSRTAD